MIKAEKYHSYGNDFLIVPPDQVQEEQYPALSEAICDRRVGVGADGCVFVGAPSGSVFSLRFLNRDGSEANMSGNGARCACAFLHHRSWSEDREIQIDTRSGAKTYRLIQSAHPGWTYRSALGMPELRPSAIPFCAPSDLDVVENYPLEIAGQTLRVTALNVGNPQCVVFVDRLPEEGEAWEIGTALGKHPRFPDRTNVSFVCVESPERLRIRIWERGVGPTHSSGTGCAGAAVAAIQTGKTRSPVEVLTTKGAQKVEWSPGKQIYLIGRSEFIARIQFQWSPID